MSPLSDLVIELVEALVDSVGAPALGVALAITDIDVTLPLEARLGQGGELRASLPRGRMATGFQVPHGRLVAHFICSEGA